MRTVLTVLVVLISAGRSYSQGSLALKPEPIALSRVDPSSNVVGPAQPDIKGILGDAPNPKPVQACPQGIGKPCAMLGGRPYHPSSMTMHDASWGKAMSHPSLIIGTSILVTSFFADYKTTRYCIDRGKAREANPLMGNSRAQELGVGITVTGISVWQAGLSKKQGRGKFALFALGLGTAVHSFAAIHNASMCG
jgi:hypothetical protein